MVPVFSRLDQDQANTFSLVMDASGIENRMIEATDGFRIEVPVYFVDAAQSVVGRYLGENPTLPANPPVRRHQFVPGYWSGVAVALLLLCVYVAVQTSTVPDDYVAVFGADARRIAGGQVYRCFTALVLHADAAHLSGNMVGITIFGGTVCGSFGIGVGWLMILACGFMGNLINAVVHEAGHLSIGASTAVFGAVGLLCALQAVDAFRTGRGWKRMALVLGGGLALLAFLGTSTHSDLGAHLFGFVAGIATGGAYRFLANRPPGLHAQLLSGAIAASVLLVAWVWGVVN
ncbi:MAG: rhomboid family intramembrane serine protease [Desulfosarcina sp.]